MFAVVVYFWRQWRETYFHGWTTFKRFAGLVVLATILTGAIGVAVIKTIEKVAFHGLPHAEIEDLFSHLEFIAPALAAVGILILIAGLFEQRKRAADIAQTSDLDPKRAGTIGAVQGLCLPFRGFSRSGTTIISAAMLMGVEKSRAEAFSFALAVVLTPAAVGREAMRLMQAERASGTAGFASAALPSVLGAVLAFLAGLIALQWLSKWLETGRWYLFGIYCLVAACAVAVLHRMGY